MLTLAPHSSAKRINQISDGLLRRPLTYCLTAFGVTPNSWASRPRDLPDLLINVSRSLAITRSSQTSGVRGVCERKDGRAEEDGITGKRDPSAGGPAPGLSAGSSGDNGLGSKS